MVVPTMMPVLNATHAVHPDQLLTGLATAVPNGVLGLMSLVLVMGVSLRALDGVPFQQRLLAMCAAGFFTSIPLVLIGWLDSFYTMALLVITAIIWLLVKD